MSERYIPDRYPMQEIEPTGIQIDSLPNQDTIHALGASALSAMEHEGKASDVMETSLPDSAAAPDTETVSALGATALDALEHSHSVQNGESERFQPYMETVPANEISGVDTSDPNFWNHHGYDKQNYMQLAENLPEVQSRLEQGATYEELRSDPALAATARAYYGPDTPITIEKQADGSLAFGSDGRHRIAAAQELGYNVDAQVIYDHALPSKETASLEDNIDTLDSADIIDLSADEQHMDQADGELSLANELRQDGLENQELAVSEASLEELADAQATELLADATDYDALADEPALETPKVVDLNELKDEHLNDSADSFNYSDMADDGEAGAIDDSSLDAYDATLDRATGFEEGGGNTFA